MNRIFILLFCIVATNANANELLAPKISSNVLMLYKNSNLGNKLPGVLAPNAQTPIINQNGLDIEEAELSFYADVDPYSHLMMTLTILPDYTYNSVTKNIDQAWRIEPEELYAESSAIQFFTLKAGKFKSAMGKHGILHTHAFPFINAPLINSIVLGEDGLLDVGASASFLLPIPWYSELTLQGVRGKDTNLEFKSPYANEVVGVGHFKNLFDINDSTTVEMGQSFAFGKNYLLDKTIIKGFDLTFKWRPETHGKYRSFLLGAEYMDRSLGQGSGNLSEFVSGYYLWSKLQFAERWDLVVRTESVSVKNSNPNMNKNVLMNGVAFRNNIGFNFNATEFSNFHLEYNWMKGANASTGLRDEKIFYLQASFTMGAHPAHGY